MTHLQEVHQESFYGELSESHAIVREAGRVAGRHDERQRILAEIQQEMQEAPLPGDYTAWVAVKDCLERVKKRINREEERF